MKPRVAALLLLVTLLSACGFHLQGRQPLPESLHRVVIEADESQSDFVSSLRNSLATAGAVVVAQKGEGVARIRVLQDEVTDRVLTVSSRNLPTDYELTYEVRLSVEGADGRPLMEPEDFLLTRVYSFDERKLLAKEREKDLLLVAMARDMTSVVLRRLGTL
jgi:LPS-assembly lipoprotein